MEPSLNGAFVSLPAQKSGFLSFTNNRNLPRLTEGQLVEVSVSRQASVEKAVTLKYRKSLPSGDITLLKKNNLKDRLSERFPNITFDEASVSVIDEATERSIALKGGEQSRSIKHRLCSRLMSIRGRASPD